MLEGFSVHDCLSVLDIGGALCVYLQDHPETQSELSRMYEETRRSNVEISRLDPIGTLGETVCREVSALYPEHDILMISISQVFEVEPIPYSMPILLGHFLETQGDHGRVREDQYRIIVVDILEAPIDKVIDQMMKFVDFAFEMDLLDKSFLPTCREALVAFDDLDGIDARIPEMASDSARASIYFGTIAFRSFFRGTGPGIFDIQTKLFGFLQKVLDDEDFIEMFRVKLMFDELLRSSDLSIDDLLPSGD